MCMTVVGAPQVAMQLVSMVYLAYQASPDVLEQTLDCSEYFAGGMQASSFDVLSAHAFDSSVVVLYVSLEVKKKPSLPNR